ncbi:MAG TPA: hypothetical protein VFX30_04175 [bacterium]|nr:hypothetical protein [bacterium]
MDYQTYYDRAQEGSKKFDAGDVDGAIRVFEDLVASDLAEVDKAIMCLNVATIYEKSGKTDEALRWLDRGIAIERLYCRSNVAENKALLLIRLERPKEALEIYKEYVTKPYVGEEQKARFLNNMQVLESQA